MWSPNRSAARTSGLIALTLVTPVLVEAGSGSLGPAPRDDDGRFVNFAGELDYGSALVRIPFFWRRVSGSFRDPPGAPERIENDGAFLRENAKQSVPTVTWIGHATLLVQMDHVSFLTDPIWFETPSPVSFAGPRRFVSPGVAMHNLPPIDFVLISHNHYDHLDLPTLTTLAKRDAGTRFYVPLENAELLRENGVDNVRELDWGSSVEHDGVRIHCLPAQHWSKRGIGDDRKSLWSSWAVVGPGRRFYFAGDTGYFDRFVKIAEAIGPFDLVAVPIGAYQPVEMMRSSHLNPEEAVQTATDLQARRVIAMHYGTFDLSDEPLEEPPRRFLKAVQASPLHTEASAWLLKIGETRRF